MTTNKFLGIVIDEYLLDETTIWTKCVKKVPSDIFVRLGGLNHMLLVKHLYLSIMLWFNRILITAALYGTNWYHTNRLQSLQNGAARVILGYRNKHGQSEAALNKLQWKTLLQRRLEEARLIIEQFISKRLLF